LQASEDAIARADFHLARGELDTALTFAQRAVTLLEPSSTLKQQQQQQQHTETSTSSVAARPSTSTTASGGGASAAVSGVNGEWDFRESAVLESAALVGAEVGDGTWAMVVLRRALLHACTASVLLNLAELSGGADALRCYDNGIRLLREEHALASAQGSVGEAGELAKQVSLAYTSAAELYLTDLCEQADAPQQCEHLLKQALQADPSNPQPLQVMASLYISLHRPAEATTLLSRSLALWLPGAVAGAAADTAFGAEPPSVDYRIASARLLQELQQWETAIRVLGRCAEVDTPWLFVVLCGVSVCLSSSLYVVFV
jgi:tetratricopeptide (TPR) repeat protein